MRKKKHDKTFSVGILLLSLSLVVASVYLLIRSNEKLTPSLRAVNVSEKVNDTKEKGAWKVYRDENLSYSITYPSLLEPRTIEGENYLSMVIFFVPEGVKGSGLAISVRESNLDEEVDLIKEEIQKDPGARLVNEEAVEAGGVLAKRLDFEPIDETVGEERTIIVMNSGKYSYALSSTPDQIDLLISNFEIF